MKYALFFLACLFFAGRAHAQGRATYLPEVTRLKVVFTKNGMNVTYLNQVVPIKDTKALDSLVKTIPDPQHLRIEYESMNADPEQSLAIIRTLEKCNCHLMTKSTAIKE